MDKQGVDLIAERDAAMAERQYAYDRIATLITERDAALAERDMWKARAEAIVIPTADVYEEQVATITAALTEARRVLRMCQPYLVGLELELLQGTLEWEALVDLLARIAAVLAKEEK